MTLSELKNDYLKVKHQFIILSSEGLIVESCNSLVDLSEKYNQSIFTLTPFFESLESVILSLENNAPLAFDNVGMDFLWDYDKYNVTFLKDALSISCILEKITGQSEYLRSVQQDRNETTIAKELVMKQSKIIELKSKEVLDSLNYALFIQQGIFTPEKTIKQLLTNYFLLYLPKDVVSGDFYWFAEKGSKVIFTTPDSTGHGVHGAFMSIIGTFLFNDVVLRREILQPNKILNAVRSGMISVLRQDSVQNLVSDSMDAALCCLDKETNILDFSGAHNSLIIVRGNSERALEIKTGNSSENVVQKPILTNTVNSLYEIKADKFPVGIGYNSKSLLPFTNHSMQMYPGDLIYIYTDGYADQFGGEDNKKFRSKNLKTLILSMAANDLNNQKLKLKEELDKWKGDIDQVDDICILGVRV